MSAANVNGGEPRAYRHAGAPALSPREREALRLISEGFTDVRIAKNMSIAPSTAQRFVRDILSKLDAYNRAHAVHIAHQKGILK